MSCGLAGLAPNDTKSVEELLKEADIALHEAKERGRNSVAVYGG